MSSLPKLLPEFARELEGLLEKEGRADLAQQVAAATIVQRCDCHDDFCASFYLMPKHVRTQPGDRETLDLEAEQGMVLVDVVNGKLAHVEVLFREDVREILDRCF